MGVTVIEEDDVGVGLGVKVLVDVTLNTLENPRDGTTERVGDDDGVIEPETEEPADVDEVALGEDKGAPAM